MNRRVLLVDDSASFREGVRQALAPHFQVSAATSGAEALACCERGGPFAVVVSDQGMPGMSGVELLAELRARWPDTARIMLTGCADLALALEALEQGAIFRFLTKPPLPARLVAAVAEGVERFHQLEQERLFTEQLVFAREVLQSLGAALEGRLERELERLGALERATRAVAASGSPEEVLENTAAAVRSLLGARTAEVRASRAGLEIVPGPALGAGERRSLAILAGVARGELASSLARAKRREVERATLRALERLARHRDDETGEHLRRVSAYCGFLARALREDGRHADVITDEFVEHLALAAPLHDLGKVAIPDAILFKPAKLDPREWEVMRTHAQVGADILRGVCEPGDGNDLLRMAHEIAWTHHERWDGTGYPRGLAREAIPLAGRIMALADCYDALTSERPYKHAWPHEAAVHHVREQRGLAFDPELVDAFLARLDGIQAILTGSARPRAEA